MHITWFPHHLILQHLRPDLIQTASECSLSTPAPEQNFERRGPPPYLQSSWPCKSGQNMEAAVRVWGCFRSRVEPASLPSDPIWAPGWCVDLTLQSLPSTMTSVLMAADVAVALLLCYITMFPSLSLDYACMLNSSVGVEFPLELWV